MHPYTKLTISLLSALWLIASGWAYGAGAGGGGSIAPASSGKAKTPEQLAASQYRAGLRQKNKATTARTRASDAANDKAKAKQQRKSDKAFAKAVVHFKKALQFDPQDYKAANELGYSLRQTGDHLGAVSAYNYALQLKPNFLEAIEYRGEAYVALGQFEQARRSYLRLYREDQTLAAQLIGAMSDWIAERRQRSDAMNDSEQAFADWVSERRRLVGFSSDPTAQRSQPW